MFLNQANLALFESLEGKARYFISLFCKPLNAPFFYIQLIVCFKDMEGGFLTCDRRLNRFRNASCLSGIYFIVVAIFDSDLSCINFASKFLCLITNVFLIFMCYAADWNCLLVEI